MRGSLVYRMFSVNVKRLRGIGESVCLSNASSCGKERKRKRQCMPKTCTPLIMPLVSPLILSLFFLVLCVLFVTVVYDVGRRCTCTCILKSYRVGCKASHRECKTGSKTQLKRRRDVEMNALDEMRGQCINEELRYSPDSAYRTTRNEFFVEVSGEKKTHCFSSRVTLACCFSRDFES